MRNQANGLKSQRVNQPRADSDESRSNQDQFRTRTQKWIYCQIRNQTYCQIRSTNQSVNQPNHGQNWKTDATQNDRKQQTQRGSAKPSRLKVAQPKPSHPEVARSPSHLKVARPRPSHPRVARQPSHLRVARHEPSHPEVAAQICAKCTDLIAYK